MQREITGQTTIIGILGHPVKHTFSPQMHNAAFDETGLDYRYLPFDVDPGSLQKAVEGIRALKIAGFNVTIPHKEAIIPFIDQLSREAQLIGAVNTVCRERDLLVGYNTDGAGFVRAFKELTGYGPAGKSFLLLGAGGASKAVSVQLAIEGAEKIIISNRTGKRGKELVEHLKQNFVDTECLYVPLQGSELTRISNSFDVVVNTTSVGMRQDDPRICPPEILSNVITVCDLIYNPAETTLISDAKKIGAAHMNGMGMLLYQGAEAFEKWTGNTAPIKTMRHVLASLTR